MIMKPTIIDSANHFIKWEFRKIMRIFLFLFLIISVSDSMATVYFSRTSGNWNDPSTWWTEANGSILNLGTYPVSGDIVNIMDGHTITITKNEACTDINIGGGKSGILQFGNAGNFTLSVSGNVNVNTNAIFHYASNSGRKHNLE